MGTLSPPTSLFILKIVLTILRSPGFLLDFGDKPVNFWQKKNTHTHTYRVMVFFESEEQFGQVCHLILTFPIHDFGYLIYLLPSLALFSL